MEPVAMDIFGPLRLTAAGNRYVLAMSDYFTKWVEAVVLPDQEAKTKAEGFVTHFVTKFQCSYTWTKATTLRPHCLRRLDYSWV